MRISDWSSDVCSSDLQEPPGAGFLLARPIQVAAPDQLSRPIPPRTGFCDAGRVKCRAAMTAFARPAAASQRERKRVVEGTRGSGRFSLGGRRQHKKKKNRRKLRKEKSK